MTVFEAARKVSAIEAARRLDLPVKRSGSRYVTRCLFHDDKTPSMTLYPDEGGFYCFGCQKHGDAVTLYQQALGLKPLDAARRVCADFGLEANGVSSAPRADARVLRKKLLAFREQHARDLVERRTQAAQRMAAREDEMYRLNLPFDQWWDDPEWAKANAEQLRCEEELMQLDLMQMKELWNMYREQKEETNGNEPRMAGAGRTDEH